ncbi:hypothetical protein JF50_09885 [Pseudoalteromonas luteoviolacea]|uniref:Uncharacterized protein n=1 Tax=Pseudoalteromonas luteoviolacea TaxID=43657 RepID=A0A0C1QA13_9GAMM|nr:hypothetical protein [Pseudoalteromonas luteoviolacea]KID57496.1 hypothetical protein JF50_09885 [Pseudoalteromonas luteoviolacea]
MNKKAFFVESIFCLKLQLRTFKFIINKLALYLVFFSVGSASMTERALFSKVLIGLCVILFIVLIIWLISNIIFIYNIKGEEASVFLDLPQQAQAKIIGDKLIKFL